jgi:predicted metal-binding membrane protein
MSRAEAARSARDRGLRPAYAATRARIALVVTLCLLAAAGWWWTIRQMSGMVGHGPWTALGSVGWFLGVWIVMMAAMMFPSVAPTVALYSRMSRKPLSSAFFVTGYLLTWTMAGVVAYLIGVVGQAATGDLAWEHGGRVLTGLTLLVAAAYELTPLKHVCLGKCRSPLGMLLGSWRDGRPGALRMGIRNGAWCVGCCWALMASLFALGFMSPLWMALVATLIAIEKTLPWRRVATYGVTGILLVLGVLVIVAPDLLAVPTMMPMQQPMR